MELLLEKGAKLEAKDRNGLTPLSYAALSRQEAVVGCSIRVIRAFRVYL
jgi:ankyrin repeat protein